MPRNDVTEILAAVQRGAPAATERLFDVVHGELQRMAADKMQGERAGHTLQPTALVHEAYLRLLGNQDRLEDRAHFFGAAARAMERVLVDHARRRQADKRGGADAQRVSLHELDLAVANRDLDVFAVHEAIDALEAEDTELAALVRYRYFVGMTLEQIAAVCDTSLATIKRRWAFARAWLYDRLQA
ncbi:MAG: ECF-type sigma factor [Planctomycetota bacterium]